MERIGVPIGIVRPLNGAMAGAAVWIGWAIQKNEGLFTVNLQVLLLVFSAFLMLSGGNILNDLNDIWIDRFAHPDRAIPKGSVSRRKAIAVLCFLFILSLVTSFAASVVNASFTPFFICLLAGSSLAVYELYLKRTGLPGNVLIALLSGLSFVYGASLEGFSPLVISIFLLASIGSLGREVVKDIEDVEHDRGFRESLPMRIGKNGASWIARCALWTSVLLSFLPIMIVGGRLYYLLPMLISDSLFIIASIVVPGKPGLSSKMAKAAMVFAIFSFMGFLI